MSACLLPAGCGLAGSDAYGRPDPCPGAAEAVRAADGSIACGSSQNPVVVSGAPSPGDPRVAAQMTSFAAKLRRAVLDTDGETARTFDPTPDGRGSDDA